MRSGTAAGAYFVNWATLESFLHAKGVHCVLLVADHMLFRQAVAQSFTSLAAMRTLHCGSVQDAMVILRREKIDVAIINYELCPESAFVYLGAMKAMPAVPHVLIVAAGLTVAQAQMLVHDGVAGIFLKDQSFESLIDAVRTIAEGKPCIGPRYFAALLAGRSEHAYSGNLTDRERRTLAFVLQGLANKEIATAPNISEGTVKSTIQRLFEKLGVCGLERNSFARPWNARPNLSKRYLDFVQLRQSRSAPLSVRRGTHRCGLIPGNTSFGETVRVFLRSARNGSCLRSGLRWQSPH